MYIPFNEMPDSARVWIYQSSRDFSQSEETQIAEALGKFTNSWQAHGADLQASYQIAHSRFIIIAANQDFHAPSGCSIDASVAVIRQIEQAFGVALLDRSQIAYRNQNGNIQAVAVSKLKSEIKENQAILPDSIIFNNMVETVGQLKNQWEVTAQNSWMARYFDVPVA